MIGSDLKEGTHFAELIRRDFKAATLTRGLKPSGMIHLSLCYTHWLQFLHSNLLLV